MDHPDTVLVREVLGRRPEDEESEPEEDEDESESEDDMEEESGDEDSERTKGGALSTQNPFALLDDSS